MQHQIKQLICLCEDRKYRLKKNCISFENNWYESEYLENETIFYDEERYWIDDCRYSDYLEEYLPEEVFITKHFYCEGCENYFHENERTEHVYGNTSYCNDCFYENHTYCRQCDESIRTDDSRYSEITQCDYCEYCFGELHSYCENCGNDYWAEDGCNCGVSIHNYSYKPDPIFFKNPNENSKYFLGVELETESKGNCRSSCAEEINEISKLYYLKNDSSIEDGFEIVTHPFSHSWYNERKSIFNDLLDTLRDHRFRSYNTSTCGIHIHVTKSYLSGLDIAKLHLFFYQNEELINVISQRNPNNLNQWGKIKKDKKAIYDQSKKKGGSERYTAINLQNHSTIEFRIFRGTLNDSSFHKNIEFVIAMCNFVKVTSLQQLTKEQFFSYIENDKNYKNLKKFMETKQCV